MEAIFNDTATTTNTANKNNNYNYNYSNNHNRNHNNYNLGNISNVYPSSTTRAITPVQQYIHLSLIKMEFFLKLQLKNI